MKNKMRITWILSALLILALAMAAIVFAVDPGSSDDPLVTKSYVDQKIKEINAGSGATPAIPLIFQPVKLEGGKTMILDEGTELVLRIGSAKTIVPGINGISDLTGGTDLVSGKTVPKNHLLLAPRSDGRGIKAETEIWVMVKGSYIIK